MNYLHNTWYVVALSSEVSSQDLFNRKILDQSLLVYRREDGEAVTLLNRCPHRFVPLHFGRRVGDDIVCKYHGLRFDCSGKCVESPHGDGNIPKTAAVLSFPTSERHGFIWVWMGNSELADVNKIPKYTLLDDGNPNSKAYSYMKVDAHYEIIVDNIMDLNHVDHLHCPLVNSTGKLSLNIPKVIEDGNDVSVSWDWHQDPPLEVFSAFLPNPGRDAAHHFSVVWTAPSSILLTASANQSHADDKDALISWNHHLMTPETETSTHYFYATRRNWLVEDALLNKTNLNGAIDAFNKEDRPFIEAAQLEMGTADLNSLKPVLLSRDAAPIRARRKLQMLIVHER